MSFPKLVNMAKNTPFFPILHVFAPLNDVRAYIALSWKTTLITWIFLRGWYPTSNTSGPPGCKVWLLWVAVNSFCYLTDLCNQIEIWFDHAIRLQTKIKLSTENKLIGAKGHSYSWIIQQIVYLVNSLVMGNSCTSNKWWEYWFINSKESLNIL